jgi:hypothetical protein
VNCGRADARWFKFCAVEGKCLRGGAGLPTVLFEALVQSVVHAFFAAEFPPREKFPLKKRCGMPSISEWRLNRAHGQ